MTSPIRNIVIFASGNGTNAEAIIRYFKKRSKINISMVLSNNKNAYVLERAKNHGIPSFVFNADQFYREDTVLQKLKEISPDLIVLAGFMWLVPKKILNPYPNKIINIHPALLPNYGGKGMYGHHVHEAVSRSGDFQSGISIHFVNEKYDQGQIIFQAKCKIHPHEDPESIAGKIHMLEYEYYPKVIEQTLQI